MKIINMWQHELSKIMKDNLIVDKHKYHPFSLHFTIDILSEVEITVGHQTISDHLAYLSEQISFC